MKYYLVTSRSITQAQRMSAALERGGVSVNITRAPRALSEAGCGYAVRIDARGAARAAELLRAPGLRPAKVFEAENGVYREVRHGIS
jgi:hypothetical protein